MSDTKTATSSSTISVLYSTGMGTVADNYLYRVGDWPFNTPIAPLDPWNNDKSWMCQCYRCTLAETAYCKHGYYCPPTNTLNWNGSMMDSIAKTEPQKEEVPADESAKANANANVNVSLRPRNVQSFEALAAALPVLYERKNVAYGDSFTKSVAKYGKVSALARMSDKWNRLENLMLGGGPENDESMVDTLLDLASYCIMSISALKEHQVQDIVDKLLGK